ncbi:MAG: SUMF1/EgtB/PvdO family nonheme iron enzyme [Myxococcota bacterium]
MERTIVCPECGTEQRADSPFCESCGFRLRSQETKLEGLPTISPEMLKRSAHDPSRPTQVTTAPEVVSAVAPHVPHDTIVDAFTEDPADASRAPSTSGDVAPESAPIAMPRLAAFALVWAVITAIGVASVLYGLERSAEDARARAVVVVEHQKLAIAPGAFKQGLDERTRSFILRTCLKLAEDSEQCEQDTLLTGEFPQEETKLGAYAIDNTEVTVGRYRSCVGEGVCEAPEYKGCKVYTHQGLQLTLRVPKAMRAHDMPQVCVTRAQAQTYCAHVGGHLPTHEQWERAARGSDGRLFPWGLSWDSTLANWAEQDVVRTSVLGRIDGFSYTAPPGQFEGGKSPSGAYDMAGNVAEWVAGEGEEGVARGGSWVSDPFEMRTTGRKEIPADKGRTDVGFRCAYAPGA